MKIFSFWKIASNAIALGTATYSSGANSHSLFKISPKTGASGPEISPVSFDTGCSVLESPDNLYCNVTTTGIDVLNNSYKVNKKTGAVSVSNAPPVRKVAPGVIQRKTSGYLMCGQSAYNSWQISTFNISYSTDTWQTKNNAPYTSWGGWNINDGSRGSGYFLGGMYSYTIVSRKNFMKLSYSTETYSNFSSTIVGLGAYVLTNPTRVRSMMASVKTDNFAYCLSNYAVNESNTSAGYNTRLLKVNLVSDTISSLANYLESNNQGYFFHQDANKGYTINESRTGNGTSVTPLTTVLTVKSFDFSTETLSLSSEFAGMGLPMINFSAGGGAYYYSVHSFIPRARIYQDGDY